MYQKPFYFLDIVYLHQSLEERLLDLALSFEGATVDKNDQDELSIEMKKQLETANRFREVSL